MADMKPFEVDVSPEMQLYKILQRQSYGVATALAEFVDNALQSFLDKRQAFKAPDGKDVCLKVEIDVDTKSQSIVIKDNAGGIKRADFQRAIRMGHTDGFQHGSTSLSVYGIGMKSSAIWFSDKWKIETSALGSKARLKSKFDLDALLLSGSTKMTVKPATTTASSHFTKITISKCLRELSEADFRDNVLPYLQETFFKYHDCIQIKINFDGLKLESNEAYLVTPDPLVYPPVDKQGHKVSEDEVVWKKHIDLKYAGRSVTGFIMIMDKGSYHSPGIRLLRNRRVILGTKGGNRPNKPQSIMGTSNKFTSQRIYGELHLDDFPVNFMKTDFDENLEGLYRTLSTYLKGDSESEDLVHQATYFRAGKAGSKNSGTQNKGGTQGGKTKNKKSKSSKKKPPQLPQHIQLSDELDEILNKFDNKKAARLYSSLCRISLVNEPVLAYVAAWTLLESLATYLGKGDQESFESFYNNKINKYSKSRDAKNELRVPIKDIHSKGNMNKHSGKYEAMNAQQLVSDFETIEAFLIYCGEEILEA